MVCEGRGRESENGFARERRTENERMDARDRDRDLGLKIQYPSKRLEIRNRVTGDWRILENIEKIVKLENYWRIS